MSERFDALISGLGFRGRRGGRLGATAAAVERGEGTQQTPPGCAGCVSNSRQRDMRSAAKRPQRGCMGHQFTLRDRSGHTPRRSMHARRLSSLRSWLQPRTEPGSLPG